MKEICIKVERIEEYEVNAPLDKKLYPHDGLFLAKDSNRRFMLISVAGLRSSSPYINSIVLPTQQEDIVFSPDVEKTKREELEKELASAKKLAEERLESLRCAGITHHEEQEKLEKLEKKVTQYKQLLIDAHKRLKEIDNESPKRNGCGEWISAKNLIEIIKTLKK